MSDENRDDSEFEESEIQEFNEKESDLSSDEPDSDKINGSETVDKGL